MTKKTLQILDDADSLAQRAADLWLQWAQQAAGEDKSFHVAFSGGTTPKRLYRLLAQSPYLQKMPWSIHQFYFGDERFVPASHADSNLRMARETLLDHVPCQPDQIHAVDTRVEHAELAAKKYHQELQRHLPSRHQLPCFDLVLLGMGNDGHTASLFPDSSALVETNDNVTATFVAKMNSWRITCTYPVINNARRVLVLIEGEAKAEVLRDVLQGPPGKFPIQGVQPNGEFIWLVDKPAARLLK